MKFCVHLLIFLSSLLQVFADEIPGSEVEKELSEIKVEYFIEEFPGYEAAEVVEAFTSDTITLSYTITNDEDEPLTIIGFGGAFRDPLSGEPLVNMTANAVDNLVIEPHTSSPVRQVVNLNFAPDDYVLSPTVYVAFDNSIKGVVARSQFVSLKDAPISLFNPQLLFLEVLLLGAAAGTYFVFFYKPSSTPRRVGKSKSSATSSTTSSWVPKQHMPSQKSVNSRKRY